MRIETAIVSPTGAGWGQRPCPAAESMRLDVVGADPIDPGQAASHYAGEGEGNFRRASYREPMIGLV